MHKCQFLMGNYLEAGFPAYMMNVCLTFLETSKLFSSLPSHQHFLSIQTVEDYGERSYSIHCLCVSQGSLFQGYVIPLRRIFIRCGKRFPVRSGFPEGSGALLAGLLHDDYVLDFPVSEGVVFQCPQVTLLSAPWLWDAFFHTVTSTASPRCYSVLQGDLDATN